MPWCRNGPRTDPRKGRVLPLTLRDTANWNGIVFVTTNIGGKLSYRGISYANGYEVLLAKTLQHMRIPFTSHVRVTLDYPDGKTRTYHPDFLFDGMPYVWTSPKTGRTEVVHGFEAKSRSGGTVEPEKKRLLLAQRGINVVILDNAAIERFHAQRHLPLTPLILSP